MSNQKLKTENNIDLSQSLQKLSQLSINFLVNSFENNLKITNEWSDFLKQQSDKINLFPSSKPKDCCPPEPYCPPYCLAEINRNAFVGEVISVPFTIKNKNRTEKRYRIGVRPMVNQEGTPVPQQPQLNRETVTLQPNQSVVVVMSVNLKDGVQVGDQLQAEIVIREKEINQNICFNLSVLPFTEVPVACPLEEKEYLTHWQSWKSHFYCEQKPKEVN